MCTASWMDGMCPPLSALRYFGELEDYLWSLRAHALKTGKKRLYLIASGGGRMVTTMDRYEADWSIVERGYNAHVLGVGPKFPDSLTAIRKLRAKEAADDQYLSHWVIHDPDNPDKPLTQIRDGDGVILSNFRGDRAIEISRAFVEDNFKGFRRNRRPDVIYAGMLEYDADKKMPPEYLVAPPANRSHTVRVPGKKRRFAIRHKRDSKIRSCNLLSGTATTPPCSTKRSKNGWRLNLIACLLTRRRR